MGQIRIEQSRCVDGFVFTNYQAWNRHLQLCTMLVSNNNNNRRCLVLAIVAGHQNKWSEMACWQRWSRSVRVWMWTHAQGSTTKMVGLSNVNVYSNVRSTCYVFINAYSNFTSIRLLEHSFKFRFTSPHLILYLFERVCPIMSILFFCLRKLCFAKLSPTNISLNLRTCGCWNWLSRNTQNPNIVKQYVLDDSVVIQAQYIHPKP